MARDVTESIQKSGKSLSDIAALMEANRKQMRGEETQLGDDDTDIDDAELVDEEELDEDDEAEEETQEEEEDDEGGVGPDDDDDEADEDDAESDEQDEDEDDEQGELELEIDEDTLVELEGEEEPVSLKQLKEVYQADKTIADKIKQTEATYLEATQERAKALEDGNKAKEALTNLVKAVDQIIAQPLIQKPNEAIKSTDPARYWQQYEAFQQDQQRIQQSRQAVLNALNAHTQQVEEVRKNFKLREMAVLAQKLPALRDEKTKAQASRDILEAAAAYGFTPEEVEAAGDHRIFQMAYDAQQYRKLKSLGKEEKEERTTKIKQKISQQPKVLRSKGTSAKSRASAAEKRVKVLKARATKTGRPDDVAAFMASRRQVAS